MEKRDKPEAEKRQTRIVLVVVGGIADRTSQQGKALAGSFGGWRWVKIVACQGAGAEQAKLMSATGDQVEFLWAGKDSKRWGEQGVGKLGRPKALLNSRGYVGRTVVREW